MKKIFAKNYKKSDKEKSILLGLVELYIKTGKPIGSKTLQQAGFDFFSSATIRNYFSKLEKEGLLLQQHVSGGRIPTGKAFREYANAFIDKPILGKKEQDVLFKHLKKEHKEIKSYLEESSSFLSEQTKCSVFLSLPYFEQDFIHDIKLISLDKRKILCVIITEFGLVRTEIFYLPKDIDDKERKIFEDFFLWRLGKKDKPFFRDKKSLSKLAQYFYNEIMLKHLTHFHSSNENIYTTGISKLLTYKEFADPTIFADSLSFFEDKNKIHALLNECSKINRLTCWIGDELIEFSQKDFLHFSIIAIPYRIHQAAVGTIALLGPTRLDYPHLFGMLKTFSDILSDTLTKAIYKFKISFRSRENIKTHRILKESSSILLEDKRN